MRTFKDTRGRNWFDIISAIEGQIDITVSYPGTIRAFHYHTYKTEWMFIIKGHYKFVLTNPNETVYLSEGECIEITSTRWHGYQSIGNDEGFVMEYANKKHDLENPDDDKDVWNAYDNWEKEKK